MNLTVVGPRVFIRPDKLPDMNEDGTLHLVNYRSESTMRGTVVALGDGPDVARRTADAVLDACSEQVGENAIAGIRRDLEFEHLVNVGDRVLFSPSAGEELIFEKEVLVCMREDDIMAVIDGEGN